MFRPQPPPAPPHTPTPPLQGQVMVELLKKNPSVAVPVVLMRLEQKEAEW